jgi:hypothetical protein
VFLSFSALYLLLPPSVANQPWDSLAYAHAIETRGITGAIWGNHPLGHVMFYVAWSLVKALGYSGRALPVLQAANAIFAGTAIALSFVIFVNHLRCPPMSALGGALLLGGSYNLWFWLAPRTSIFLGSSFLFFHGVHL